MRGLWRSGWVGVSLAIATPALAQVETIDPNTASSRAGRPADTAAPISSLTETPSAPREDAAPPSVAAPAPASGASTAERDAGVAARGGTFQDNDVLAAAEGVFGKGAEGLAKLVEKVLKDQGSPNAYIVGREVGGAIAVGVRYGSGTMFHKVEGQRPVYWQGPSVGFDLGANGAKTFVLVYNLYDAQELFKRFPAAEGNAYVVGGFTASYMRRGDVVIVPIRLGVGWRLGANVGYMRFSEKARWSPF